jgi:cell wall-associated NlpC family hydrolase
VKPGNSLKKHQKKQHVATHKPKETTALGAAALKHQRKAATERRSGKPKALRSLELAARDSKRSAPVLQESSGVENDDSEYIEYRLRKGETLAQLAKKFNIDSEEIIDLNKARTKRLKPGTVVLIPRTEEDTDDAPLVLTDRPLKPWKNDDERGILVKVARSFDGAPYRYGGETVRGLDCSAFVKKMYEIFEVQLPRSAKEQFCAGPRIDKEDLTTGDLVFFKTRRYAAYPTHVGIYIGDDKFIHASSTLKRGVKVDHLSDSYFSKTYVGAVRVKAPPGTDRTDVEEGSHKASGSTG